MRVRSQYAQKNIEAKRRLLDATPDQLRAEGIIDVALHGNIGAVLTERRLFLFGLATFFAVGAGR